VVETGFIRARGRRALVVEPVRAGGHVDFIFRGLWAESGGTLSGATLPDGARCRTVLRFRSETLAEALTRLNKYSNNLMTRNLFLTLAQSVMGTGIAGKGRARGT